jgi:hypothetical protein
MDSIIIDPQTGRLLGQIHLVGEPVEADVMTSSSGLLQAYVIVSEKENLWRAWVAQQKVLLQTENSQRLARIVTYPTRKGTKGYLDIINAVNADNETTNQPKAWAA